MGRSMEGERHPLSGVTARRDGTKRPAFRPGVLLCTDHFRGVGKMVARRIAREGSERNG